MNTLIRSAAFVDGKIMAGVVRLYMQNPKNMKFKIALCGVNELALFVLAPITYWQVMKLSLRGSYLITFKMLPAYFTQEGVHNQVKARAIQLLDRVGLSQQVNQSVNKLSGGQMQRVAIARALINKPSIILADEPTANLDRKNADNVLTILKELCSFEKTTVVVATHDQHVLNYCYRCVHLSDGRLVSDISDSARKAS